MAEILLVGEPTRARGVQSILSQDGHNIFSLREIERWRERERDVLPQLIVAAVESSDPVICARGPVPRSFPAPVLFLHQQADPEDTAYLDERFVDRIRSPFTGEDLLARVDALIRLRRLVLRGRVDGEEAESRPRLKTVGRRLLGLLRTRVPRTPRPSWPYLEVVTRVAEWADRRDMFEPGHAERVTSFAALIADGLGMADAEASPLLRAAMLHDIGKIALPIEVLRKDGPLGEAQMRLMRTHPRRGANLLGALDPDPEVQKTILYHHERMDGSGYYGIEGEKVPLTARVLAVAEQYDAMTTSTVRDPVPNERALEMLRAERGTQFDSDCVDALVDALRPPKTRIPLSRI